MTSRRRWSPTPASRNLSVPRRGRSPRIAHASRPPARWRLGAAAGLRETDRLREVLGELTGGTPSAATCTSSPASCPLPPRRTRMPPAGRGSSSCWRSRFADGFRLAADQGGVPAEYPVGHAFGLVASSATARSAATEVARIGSSWLMASPVTIADSATTATTNWRRSPVPSQRAAAISLSSQSSTAGRSSRCFSDDDRHAWLPPVVTA